MTTILLTITIVSFVMTIALVALVVKLLRDERRRSAARVAALAQMADLDSPADTILGGSVAIADAPTGGARLKISVPCDDDAAAVRA